MTRSPSAQNAHVIGWPIKHSRSPMIHGHWLTKYGIQGCYTALEVAPGADLQAFFNAIRNGACLGCNITIPHKETAAALVDEISPEARCLGAINTVWRAGDRLHATSTDGAGFLAHLDQSAPGWEDQDGTILVLGAGGASRAIVDSLIRRGRADIALTNRTAARAEAVIEDFASTHGGAGRSMRAVSWDTRDAAVADAAVVINTTALGMSGQDRLTLDLSAARPDAVVADIVYAPLETELLAQARHRGLIAVDGLGMLLHQAVPGFEKWFGVRPEVTRELRDLVVADLNAVHVVRT